MDEPKITDADITDLIASQPSITEIFFRDPSKEDIHEVVFHQGALPSTCERCHERPPVSRTFRQEGTIAIAIVVCTECERRDDWLPDGGWMIDGGLLGLMGRIHHSLHSFFSLTLMFATRHLQCHVLLAEMPVWLQQDFRKGLKSILLCGTTKKVESRITITLPPLLHEIRHGVYGIRADGMEWLRKFADSFKEQIRQREQMDRDELTHRGQRAQRGNRPKHQQHTLITLIGLVGSIKRFVEYKTKHRAFSISDNDDEAMTSNDCYKILLALGCGTEDNPRWQINRPDIAHIIRHVTQEKQWSKANADVWLHRFHHPHEVFCTQCWARKVKRHWTDRSCLQRRPRRYSSLLGPILAHM